MCLYTNTCRMGNQHEELEIYYMYSCRAAILRWDGSHDRSVAVEGYSFFRKDRMRDEERELTFM